MNKKATIITTTILLIYFIFTSGFFYWASGEKETTKMVTPFSWALSAKDKGFTGIATKSDMDCVNWLLNESKQDMYIVCDSNALFLISGYHELLPDTWLQYGREDRLIIMMEMSKLEENCYLFLTDWNIKNNLYITCTDVGLRRQHEFDIVDDYYIYSTFDYSEPWEVVTKTAKISGAYKSGNSIVYMVVND